MVWGFITRNGPGTLVFINKTVNQLVYKNILTRNLLHLSKIARRIYFSTGWCTCTYCFKYQIFLTKKEIMLLDWAPKSPDLNPIEHFWGIMKRIIWNKRFESIEALKAEIMRIWNEEITAELCKKIIDSMPSRINSIIAAKGGIKK